MIVAAVVFCFLLIVLACVFHNYYHTKEKSKIDKDVEGSMHVVREVKFEIPVLNRTVKAQDCHSLFRQEHEITKITTSDRIISSSRGSFAKAGREAAHDSTLPILPIAESGLIEGKSEYKRITSFKSRQEDINKNMMSHLIKKGRNDSSDISLLPQIINGIRHTSWHEYRSRSGSDLKASATSMGCFSNDENVYATSTVEDVRKRLGKRLLISTLTNMAYKKAGKITLNTIYSQNDNILVVHVIKVYDLVLNHEVNNINPFVQLSLNPGKKQKQHTEYHEGTKQLYINEHMEFTDVNKTELATRTLKIKVYNHHWIRKDKVIGEADLILSTIDLTSQESFDLDVFKKCKASSMLVLVSICHKATFSKLEVIIQEARKLTKGNCSKLVDLYATVALYKDDVCDKRHTSVQRHTRNSTLNECLEFDVLTDLMTPLNTFSLLASFKTCGLIGNDKTLGHVIFSLTSPQSSAADHWKAVQNEPHKRHIFWHSLINPDDL